MNSKLLSDEGGPLDGAKASTLQSELERFRDLLKNYQETRDLIDRNGQIIQRASEAWVPDILEGIEEAQVLSDQALQKLPPIEERVMQQLQEYEQGRLRAINAEAQLSWYAASWMIKLRKVLRGEVKEKPTKLLRIAAPFILSFLLLLFVGSLGRLLLRWGLVYYRSLRGP
ncbi:hypothetical protein BS47DRAFT_1489710 [Hydnum rufescens UP504]|uniref:Uncharacterized protein n=1 Tax=Hydnum rufescens UP504 TaxID=1448309 RepID=A0A9P6AH30_9AGAM|nr:hypothetical protein BS47DRAFT_1489710 [Hydnum rufescens UP504]